MQRDYSYNDMKPPPAHVKKPLQTTRHSNQNNHKPLMFKKSGVSQDHKLRDKSTEQPKIHEGNNSYVSLLTDGALTGASGPIVSLNRPASTRNSGPKSITARLMNISTEHNMGELDGTINSSHSASYVVSLLQKNGKKTPTAT